MDTPDYLYYYCGQETAQKILESRQLRLSNLSGVNDFKEGIWLIDKIEEVAKSDAQKRLLRILRNRLWHYDPLICCLTMEDDSLSQWAMYSEDGKGYAIGIDVKATIKKSKVKYGYPTFKPEHEEPIFLKEVEYFDKHASKVELNLDSLNLMINTGIDLAELEKGDFPWGLESAFPKKLTKN